MNKATPTIVGAGLAGLLAAHAWPSAQVVEASPSPRAMHHALLRFRTDAVARLVGIEFRKVRVHKGIWAEGRLHTEPNIRLANLYSRKVLGKLAGERSIWSLEASDRYVAPETLYEQLVESVGARIEWGLTIKSFGGEPVVSTAPLFATAAAVGLAAPKCERAPIAVARFRVPRADVFQTVYFTDPETPMYRASITGSLLIIEAMVVDAAVKDWLPRAEVLAARAFALGDIERLDVVGQSYGKIAPIPDDERRRLLFLLTHDHNIFSLGRFATWRNVLLDDVVDDIQSIKLMMRSDAYDRKKSMR